MPNINFIGVAIAGIIGMAVGFSWYGPIFGKLWVKLMGFTKEELEEAQKKGMILNYGLGLLGQFVTAYALSLLIAASFQYFGGFSYSLILWVWLGIIVPIQMGTVLWEGKPWTLFALNSAYYLVQLLAMGLVLSYLG
ncbi:MAG: hypothetical protein UW08_C0008G0017 [Parcubacteria group bacterium GW2011_GWB1_43_8b]|nr:MAG: hypothetical protein UW08_C0008G0017 [Parcubacteria group bacterium GW2011_GWB1_43_8b]